MKITSLVSLVFAVVVGAFFRLYNIGFQCFWTEEEYTLKLIKEPVLEIISHSILQDFNPPTFYLVALLSSLVSGSVDVAIRYPSAICGILLIIVMYYLGKEIYSETAGLYSAGITVAIYPLIYYSQFGRSYAMLFLAFAIAVLYYVKVKNGDLSDKTVFAFAIASGACVWVHLFVIIPIALMVLDVLATTRNKRFLLSVVIASPLVLSFLSMIPGRGTQTINYGDTIFVLFRETPFEFFGNLFAYIVVLAGFGFYYWGIPHKRELLAITIVTVITGLIASVFTPVFPRYYAMVSLILIVFAAIPIAEASDRFLPEKMAVAAFMVFVAGLLLVQYPDFIVMYTMQKYPC